ncbi:MAG TPA: NAD(P)-dependent oxidoreductase [Lactovum miscens]|uniref:NAD-dependent epimerase/dehydratase family protein n=1 Tax=Lactovum miscens TaxID=190387 RepID=UPI002EDB14E8
MKIVIFGGSGFIGESLVKTLSQEANAEIVVISRRPQYKYQTLPNVKWLVSSVTEDTSWQTTVKEADWVIDCIGILLPNPFKKQNYQSASINPALKLIHFIAKCQKPKFIFVSAKKIPFFISPYFKAKLRVETEIIDFLADRGQAIYPTIVYDQPKQRNWTTAQLILFANHWPLIKILVKDYLPIQRKILSQEVVKILNGQNSYLSKRNY